MPTTRKKSGGSKKSASRKSSTATKKPAGRKKSTRRYSLGASEQVAEELHELKLGELRSGGSGRKVTSRKQAIAIGLAEARRAGEKVPPVSKRRKTSK